MAKDKDIKIIDGKVCVTNQALYEMLEIDESTLIRWGQKGCPKIERGWWVIQDVLKWQGVLSTSEDDPEDMSPKDKKLYYDIREKKAQSEKIEFDNAIKQGEYIAVSQLKAVLSKIIMNCRNKLLAIPKKSALQVCGMKKPAEVEELLKMTRKICLEPQGSAFNIKPD